MELVHLNDETFKMAIKSQKLVIVDFFATWCGPCKMMGPILEQVKDEVKDDVEIYKLDVDSCEKTASEFGIMSIPSIIFFKNGKQVAEHVGLMNRDDLLEMIDKNK